MSIKTVESIKNKEPNKDIWKEFSKTKSIALLGGTRSGKTSLACALVDKLKKYKPIYWFSHPKPELLKEQGFRQLESLEELTILHDSVVVIDEAQLYITKHEKKNNDLLLKILTLASQRNITLILITQVSQFINKRLESLIDVWFVKDIDYNTLKNGSQSKRMIQDYSQFDAEFFRLKVNEFLYFSRNFDLFERKGTFKMVSWFDDRWSKPYRDENVLNVLGIEKLKEF